MGKKSAAQIRRLQQRAAARGEEYVHTGEVPDSKKDAPCSKQGKNDETKEKEEDPEKTKRLKAAQKLQKALDEISKDENMNAKERRAAKRKAEAIATEESGCPASELISLMEESSKKTNKVTKEKEKKGEENTKAGDDREDTSSKKKIHGPYILFIGQIDFTTTKEGLFHHFQKELGEDLVTDETLKVRLLTDPQNNNRSRGMAFVETDTPELLYECLRLHHTQLDGRRINVERSAGGGKSSGTRKEKINEFRKEQNQFISEKVDKIIADYKAQGELEEGELDDGVLQLCKRHSAATVEAALAQYVEAKGKHMDNPSAYLTHIIGRVSVEGPDTLEDIKNRANNQSRNGDKRKTSSEHNNSQSFKRSRTESRGGRGGVRNYSKFSMEEVDMSTSQKTEDKNKSGLSRIFPSMSRGRGRGRGYM